MYIYYRYASNVPFYWQKGTLTNEIKYLMGEKVKAITEHKHPSVQNQIETKLKDKEKAYNELIEYCPQLRSRPFIKSIKTIDKINFLWLIMLTLCVIALKIEIENIKVNIVEIYDRILKLEFTVDYLVTEVGTISKNIQSLKGELATHVKRVDTHITDTHRQLNQLYEDSMKKSNTLQTIDTFVLQVEGYFQKAANYHQPREWFGLGCWPAGTSINVDAGNAKNIEDIYDSVWNAGSQSVVSVVRTIAGLETGYLYKFTTSDGYAVNVTETHPMIVYRDGTLANIAAKDVSIGDWTVTVNGKQKIVNVKKIYVENVMVYNLEMSLPQSTPVLFRSVISNGIHTLDFVAQMEHK